MATKWQRTIRLWLIPALAIGLGWAAGCNRDVRLADQDVKTVTVKPVTHYGVALDEKGSPEQTVYVLLRALRDDFLAQDKAERDAALDMQFDVCAADAIAARNPTSLGRDEYVHRTVSQWTPTVSHYVHDFETEWEKAEARLVRVGPKTPGDSDTGAQECQILMETNDPSGDPNARVVLVVGLIQDEGLWRVLRVGFTPQARALRKRTPAADPGTDTPSTDD